MVKFISVCYIFFFLFYVILLHTISADDKRTAKFLGWGVGLVRFANSPCMNTDGLQGVCYTRRQCLGLEGTPSGSCANGIGSCCIIQKSCGEEAVANNTYFVSPGFPNGYSGGSCSITIKKTITDLCQVRLDFITLSLAQPDTDGNCVNDGLRITGGSNPIFTICGENSGQHVYVGFNNASDIQLTIFAGALTNFRRVWNIKITFITCDCPTRAPTGCLQYYTALSGTVNSFNYGLTGNAMSTRQLANENYGVCVEMQPGYCSINWSQTSGDPYSFTVSGNTTTDLGTPVIGVLCSSDFVVIPNPTYTDTMVPSLVDRFCGNAFDSVTSSSKPFVLTVVTNGNEMNDAGNRGFSLQYTQQRCSGNLLG